MAISVVEKTSSGSTSNTTGYTTASVTPVADRLYTAFVVSTRGSSTDPDVPTMTHAGGLTWVQIDTQLLPLSGTIRQRVTMFRAMKSSGLSAGTCTITHANAGTGCAWSILEWDGVDTSGTDGSGAIVQSTKNTTSAGTTCTLTLGSALSTGAAHYAGFGTNSGATFSAEGSWTELPATEITYATPSTMLGAMYRLATSDTTALGTVGTSGEIAGISVEIKAAASGTPQYLVGTVDCVSTVTCSLSTPKRLAATVAASGSVTAALSTPKRLAAAVDGVSSVTATLNSAVGKTLAATVAATSSVTAALRSPKFLSAAVNAQSTVTVALDIGESFAARAWQKIKLGIGIGV